MSRVLVTGAASYLGSRICRDLLARGWSVAAIQHRTPLPADLRDNAHVTCVSVDDSESGWYTAVAEARPDAVVHLAARPGGDAAHVRGPLRDNLEAGVLLLEAMRAAGCRALVSTGTYWQYGDGELPGPTCLYAAAKTALETFIDYEAVTHGLRACTLVLYDVYGEDDPRDKLLRQLARTGATIDLTPGHQIVDLAHVDDVVRAYGMALDGVLASGLPGHVRYYLSGGQRRPLHDVVAQFETALGRPLPVRWGGRGYRPREVMRPVVGPPLPGWVPAVGLAEGLGRVARALRDEESKP